MILIPFYLSKYFHLYILLWTFAFDDQLVVSYNISHWKEDYNFTSTYLKKSSTVFNNIRQSGAPNVCKICREVKCKMQTWYSTSECSVLNFYFFFFKDIEIMWFCQFGTENIRQKISNSFKATRFTWPNFYPLFQIRTLIL